MKPKKILGMLFLIVSATAGYISLSDYFFSLSMQGEDLILFTFSILMLIAIGVFVCGMAIEKPKVPAPRYFGMLIFCSFLLTAIGTSKALSHIDFVDLVGSRQNP